jgi:hypothetical protein
MGGGDLAPAAAAPSVPSVTTSGTPAKLEPSCTTKRTARAAKVKATLKSRKALEKGKYTLRIAVTQRGGVIGISKTV